MDLDLVVVKIRGNLGNARKKSIFFMGGVPLFLVETQSSNIATQLTEQQASIEWS